MGSHLYLPMFLLCVIVSGMLGFILVRFLKHLARIEEKRWGKARDDGKRKPAWKRLLGL